jgi:hypothetical protein
MLRRDGSTDACSSSTLSVDARSGVTQRAIDRCRADLQESCLDLRIKRQMAMPLHGVDQDWDQRLEPFAADSVAGLPKHEKRLPNRFVIETVA